MYSQVPLFLLIVTVFLQNFARGSCTVRPTNVWRPATTFMAFLLYGQYVFKLT